MSVCLNLFHFVDEQRKALARSARFFMCPEERTVSSSGWPGLRLLPVGSKQILYSDANCRKRPLDPNRCLLSGCSSVCLSACLLVCVSVCLFLSVQLFVVLFGLAGWVCSDGWIDWAVTHTHINMYIYIYVHMIQGLPHSKKCSTACKCSI